MSENVSSNKSLLAKLLATENIVIQKSASAQTACFDIKQRVLTLPVWVGISNDLEDMLVVHEVGHALDTSMNDWMGAVERIGINVYGKTNDIIKTRVRGFLNVVEDARIDKRQKRRYPGARRNYLIGYKELVERDFFGTSNRDVNTFTFIDRLNMYFKGGFALVKFSPEEMPMVKKAEALETFADVETLTEEIFRFSKEKGEDQQKLRDSIRASSDEDDEEDEVYGFSNPYEDEDEDDSDTNGEVGNEDADEDENDEDADDTSAAGRGEGEEDAEVEMDNDSKATSAGAGGDDFVPESETEKAWQSKQSEMVSNDGTEFHYVTVPKPVLKNLVVDYKVFLKQNRGFFNGVKDKYGHYQYRQPEPGWFDKIREETTKFRNEDNATTSFMVKEFEMKKSADIFSRITIAKTGVLDTNKLYSYKYNEDIFRRQSVVPTGKNHGFVMFLDWSGSMQDNIKQTVKQLISLTSVCKRTQIPFEVYTFLNSNSVVGGFEFKQGDMKIGMVSLRNVLSSRMNSSELIEAYQILWALSWIQSPTDRMCGTPLNSAIVAADEVVKQFKISSKVQIVNVVFLTDGDSDPVNGIEGVNIRSYNDIGTRINNRFVLQDKQTGKDYYITNSDNKHMDGQGLTISLLKRLKDRTGCNLIGFYLFPGSINSVRSRFYGYSVMDSKFEENLKKSWSENKFVAVANHGYDDYYVISVKAMSDDVNVLDIKSDMTKSKIAKEFMRFSEKKSVNRVLLKRFIEKVA